MTYTLFECLKDRITEMLESQPQQSSESETSESESDDSDADIGKLSLGTSKAPKKEHLTKAQKRRQWDQSCGGGEKPKGWDWVDILKHLSQVESKKENKSNPHN